MTKLTSKQIIGFTIFIVVCLMLLINPKKVTPKSDVIVEFNGGSFGGAGASTNW